MKATIALPQAAERAEPLRVGLSPIEAVRIALRALSVNKLRTALTLLGIVLGIGAVIAMLAVGRGAQAAITAQIQSLGTNLLFVRPGFVQQGGVRSSAGSAQTLTYDDALAIADLPGVVGVAPEAWAFGQVLYAGQNVSTRITGVTPAYPDIRNFRVAEGEFISRAHLEARSTVAVLGAGVAQLLFGDTDPVGQTVKISVFGRPGVNFRVIGVMEPKGGSALGNQDDQVFIPITTLQQRLTTQRTAQGAHTVALINVQVAREDLMDTVVAQIGDLLRARHRVAQDDFIIQSQRDMLQIAGQITGIMTALLGSIAGISLVVGGIGIMNIMLVSVTERTREIGIRKAVGARRRDILLQFLIEAMTVSGVGGLVGIALGAGLAFGISQIDISGGTGTPQRLQTLITSDAVLLAVGVSLAVGLFFGIYPAMRAARLHPIEALRYE